MSFGQNLQFLRKTAGITQEGLTEKLEVSRQSVSKWESDNSFPEMEKLVQLCDIFGCSMDTLVKGDAEKETAQDNNGYDKFMTNYARKTTLATGLVFLALVYGGVADALKFPDALMNIVFMLLIVCAIMLFIVSGNALSDFRNDNKNIKPFYKQEEIKAFKGRYSVRNAVGIGIFLMGFVFSSAVDGMKDSVIKEVLENSVFLICLGIGACIVVYNGLLKDKFDIDKYNRIAEGEKNTDDSRGKWYGTIMIISTIVFLVTGIIWKVWEYNWLSFVVGGLLCGIVALFGKSTKE